MRVRRYAFAILIAAGAAAAAIVIANARLFEGSIGQLEYKTMDYRMRSARRLNADSTVVRLVLFDSAYVAAWPYLAPFPRAALAALVDAVAAAGAKAIGLDVYLDRRYPALDRIDHGDARLRAAIRRAGNVVLVGGTAGSNLRRAWLPPDPYFADVAAAVSSTDLPTPFETVRDGVLTVRSDQGLIPSFALALYALARDLAVDSLMRQAERTGALDLAGIPDAYAKLPADATQTFPILFEGPPSRPDRDDGTFRTLSAFAVSQIAAQPNAAAFLDVRDKIVILGSGFHASEQFRSPFYEMRRADGQIYGWTYGAEVHANALQNLLSGDFIKPVDAVSQLLLVLALAGAVVGATFLRGAKLGAVTATVLTAATIVMAWLLFARSFMAVPVVGPTLATLLAFVGATSYVSIVEGREKRMIKGAFGKFVSPAVVEELVADPSKLRLGGEKRAITVLFSDLTGFTAMSEKIEPEKLVEILNEYLDEMSSVVISYGGTLDKYIGDAIMAIYGAPQSRIDHAVVCCRTALGMQRKLEQLNRRWQAANPGWPTLQMRIGVNSGTPVVGNIGGQKQFNYTALGDTVNLAARLEPACKLYDVPIVLAQPTRDAAGDEILVRELDLLAVYGREEPVRVYELLGLRAQPLGARTHVVAHYNRGLAAFRHRDFELALQYFQAALNVDPADGPARLYRVRCEEYLVQPPPADWDFVERRQVK